MPSIRNVLDSIEELAPKRFAFAFDKVGLQVGEVGAEVNRVCVSLDRSLGAIQFAKDHGCELLVAHHPLIFTPLETVDNRSHTSKSVLLLASSEIGFIAAHTNWDAAKGGINDVLADLLGLGNVQAFGTGAEVSSYKLVFFCPAESADRIVDALSDAGAGTIGAYRRCMYQNAGEGSFIPSANANPAIGQRGEKAKAPELRIEMLVDSAKVSAAEKALLRAHPYETPAYDVYPLKDQIEQPAGRLGELEKTLSLRAMGPFLNSVLGTKSYIWGDPEKQIRKVAVVGGAADGEWMHAQRAGADVLVTGEVRQHIAVEASESGMSIIAAGHYATEHPGTVELGRQLALCLPEIRWLIHEPSPGMHGRPLIDG